MILEFAVAEIEKSELLLHIRRAINDQYGDQPQKEENMAAYAHGTNRWWWYFWWPILIWWPGRGYTEIAQKVTDDDRGARCGCYCLSRDPVERTQPWLETRDQESSWRDRRLLLSDPRSTCKAMTIPTGIATEDRGEHGLRFGDRENVAGSDDRESWARLK